MVRLLFLGFLVAMVTKEEDRFNLISERVLVISFLSFLKIRIVRSSAAVDIEEIQVADTQSARY
jgi:hypothetical protein